MSTSIQIKGKKAKLDTASIPASTAANEPVAGPSSERLDHVQKADNEDDDEDEAAMDGDSEELDGSDDDDEDAHSSGVSEGSVSGDEDEEDDYEDILAANENAGKKKSECLVAR